MRIHDFDTYESIILKIRLELLKISSPKGEFKPGEIPNRDNVNERLDNLLLKHSRTIYLEIFDLPSDASHERIAQRYKELLKIAHPDHGGNGHHFGIIQLVYERLTMKKD